MSHSRPGALLGERSKQLFPATVIPVSKAGNIFTTDGFTLCVHSSSPFSRRRVTIRLPASAQAQQSTGSSAVASQSTSPTGWLRPSIRPPTPLDNLYLSASQAALRLEVGDASVSAPDQTLRTSSLIRVFKINCSVIHRFIVNHLSIT